jgi:hypothetical protein
MFESFENASQSEEDFNAVIPHGDDTLCIPPRGLKLTVANILTFLALRELFAVVPMSVPIFAAESALLFSSAPSPFEACFSHTGGSADSPSAASIPPYCIELEPPVNPSGTSGGDIVSPSINQEPVAVASDGNHNIERNQS